MAQKILSPLAHLSRVEIGALAEDLVHYRLRRAGVDIYKPTYSKQSVDFMVLAGARALKCQVKATAQSNLIVRLRHTFYADGKYQRKYYGRGVVDIFILVDLINENVFVVPDDAVGNRSVFCLSPKGRAWPFRDQYHFLLDP